MLQCILPCLDGLLASADPRLNELILDLFWELSCWHALAKLRLHTETTLSILERFTETFGAATRRFAAACDDIDTRELPNEEAARGRREVNLAAKGKKSTKKVSGIVTGSKQKKLNLSTFKYHHLGHYPWAIRRCGTTDNYTTQTVCLHTS